MTDPEVIEVIREANSLVTSLLARADHHERSIDESKDFLGLYVIKPHAHFVEDYRALAKPLREALNKLNGPKGETNE